jgi:hypothetical protein
MQHRSPAGGGVRGKSEKCLPADFYFYFFHLDYLKVI